MKNDSSRKTAIDIFNAAVQAVDPYKLVKGYAESILAAYHKEHCNKLYLVSFGKAAFAMTKALAESSIRDIITKGIVITKYGHAQGALTGNIEIFEAGHPVPDAKGLAATKHVIDMLKNGDSQTLVLCLISGGGSALLVAPCNNITLDEKQRVTELLLKAGANINELNTVRKHISAIKGGRLAEIAYPSKVISLILSDVIGDSLDAIASGPTSPDETTYQDAIHVIEKYGLRDNIPDHILHISIKGSEGNVMETPKSEHPVFERVENIIIGSNKIATGAAAKKAIESGFETTILTSELQGEAREVAKWLALKAIEIRGQGSGVIKAGFEGSRGQGVGGSGDKKICLISGGETTVTVQGNGIGGRNMELALVFALEIADTDGMTLLSAGTDGTDGPTDAAGAIVNGQTIKKAKAKGLDPLVYLEHNDSYIFFKNTGELFVTGSTGTNVMDIQIIILK
ncbi:MAG: glycerate kinase [Proteobacteria bacterium]|nr:glycerate kinase [Pseudomonadota bacterium]